MTAPTLPAFRRGAEEAKAASAKGSSFDRIPYFSLKDDGDVAILRFLTDFIERPDGAPGSTGWITADMHNMVPTKGQPSDYKGKSWPRTMSAVCRNDTAFRSEGGAPMFPDCFICSEVRNSKGEPYKAQSRQFAFAVEREEVIRDGRIDGYRTKMRKVTKKDGDKEVEVDEPCLVVVNMAWKNFYSKLDGMGKYYLSAGEHGILERDFRIVRKGTGTETEYDVVPMDPLDPSPNSSEGFKHWDASDPKIAGLFGAGDYCSEEDRKHPLLAEIVLGQASDDHYARFFDTRVSAPSSGGSNGASAPKPENDADASAIADMAARVKGLGAAATAEAADSPAPAAEPVAQAAVAQAAPPAGGGYD